MLFEYLLNEDKQELQATTNAIVKDITSLVWKNTKKGGLYGIIDKVVGIYPYNKFGRLWWGILLQVNTSAATQEGKIHGQQLIAKYKQQYPQHNFRLEVNENAIKILVDEIATTPQNPQDINTPSQ